MESIKVHRYIQKAIVAWLTVDENLSAAEIYRRLEVSGRTQRRETIITFEEEFGRQRAV